METAGKVLGFREEGLRGLHFYIEGLDYPIVAAEYSEKDALAFRMLNRSMKKEPFTSEKLCEWCINHRIYFSFLYGFQARHFFADPVKMWRYLEMRVRLRDYSLLTSPANE